MDRILWILLGLIAATLVILLTFGASGTVAGVSSDQFANAVYLGLIAAALLAGGRLWSGGFSNALRNAAIWLAILVGLMALYNFSPALQSLMVR